MKNFVIAALALASLVVAGPAHAQSVSCDKPIGDAETAICADQSLMSLEAERAALAGDAFDSEWIGQRDACGGNVDCLTTTYLNQVQLLRLGARTITEATVEEPSLSPTVAAPEAQVTPTTNEADTEGQGGGSADDSAAIGFFAAVFGALFLIVGLGVTIANYSWNKFQYRVFLNPINFFNGAAFFLVVVAFTLHEDMNVAGPVLLVALGIWLIVLIQNVRRTNILMGPAITLTQNLAFVLLFFVWLSRQKTRP